MDIPVTVTTHDIEVTVSETVVDVLVTATVQTIVVTVEYGISATQVQALLTKENIDGLKETDSPQFIDAAIIALNSVTNGGEVTDVDYSWFKGLYASLVDGSVKSFIIGIVNFLKQIGLVTPVAETATFTLALTHLYKGIRCNSATDMDCNIPLNSTVAFPIGSVISIQQIGNGVVTAKGVSGVTLNGDPKTAGQYKFIQIWKTDVNVWNVIGGVE